MADVQDDLAKFTKNLTAGDVDLRREAAKGLADLGADAKPAAAQLVKALGDKDLFVRRFAAQALGQCEADPKVAVPALSKLMNDEDKVVLEAVVTALGKMGPPAVPALTQGLKSKSHQVKLLSAKGLGQIGAQAKSSVQALIDAFNAPPARGSGTDRRTAENERMALRKAAAEALGNIGPDAKGALTVLQESLNERVRDRDFRNVVNAAVRKIEGTAKKN